MLFTVSIILARVWMDGGRVAGAGFLYQYLRTAEVALLALATDARVHACRVEGDPYPTEIGSADSVDFDFTDPDGRVLRSFQVKSGTAGRKLSASDALAILLKLVARDDAEQFVLMTNKKVSAAASEVARILALDLAPADRLAALRSAVRGPAARHLDCLTEEHVHRLGRCEVRVDHRSWPELRDDLLHAIEAVRRADERGIGPSSSGLLLACLHSEIHRRAAFLEDAVWTMSDIRELLRLDDRALFAALGQRDWGGVLGLIAPIPDVPRTELRQAISAALQPFRPAGITVARCALTGLSGIGKSSLASAYVAECLDAYEMVFWLDASNPPYTLVDGFRAAARKLLLEPGVPADQLREAVHERLTRMAGRWLLVFDDAHAADISPWIPRIGDGDVLITTIDEARAFGARPVPVGGMSPGEAAALLAARLAVDTEEDPASSRHLGQLAAALEHWPLALELAAGYLQSCAYRPSDIPFYLETLKLRSLDDQSSVPDGYPTTLIAAINLALGRLAASGADHQTLYLAANMVTEGSYLSARRIPVHLLVSAGQTELETLPGDKGPVIFEDPVIHEAIRCLRSISFVRMDEPLPRRETDRPTAEHTIAMNAVLQEIIRARTEDPANLEKWSVSLERLALHLDHWLSAAAHNGEADKAHQLVPHAATLVGHLRRLGLGGGRIPLLIGNLADIYMATNDLHTAISLLETELKLILDAGSDDFLTHQARLHLAQALAAAEALDPGHAAEATAQLEHIVVYCQRLASEADTHEEASRFCSRSLGILSRITSAQHENDSSGPLAELFADILSRLPATWESLATEAAQKASAMLSAGMPEKAEDTCRPYMTPLKYGDNLQLELHRLLTEALAHQGKWQEAETEIDAMAGRLGREPLYRQTAEDALHNVSIVLAMAALLLGGVDGQFAASAFNRLMSAPCFMSILHAPQPANQPKFRVLQLALAATQSADADIARYAAEVEAIDPNAWLPDGLPWLILYRAALATVIRNQESPLEERPRTT
jgi:hypothetical protein